VVFANHEDVLDSVVRLLRLVSENSLTIDQRVIAANLIKIQFQSAVSGVLRLQDQLREDIGNIGHYGGLTS
jgi:hypothetical protein